MSFILIFYLGEFILNFYEGCFFFYFGWALEYRVRVTMKLSIESDQNEVYFFTSICFFFFSSAKVLRTNQKYCEQRAHSQVDEKNEY
jgi:hypothetical protein